MNQDITLSDYQASLDRVRPWVRKTPLVETAPWQPVPGIELRLKAECCQVTG